VSFTAINPINPINQYMPPTPQSPNLKAYLLLLFGLFAIGFSAIFVRSADAPGTISGFYRMGIGSAVVALPFLNHIRKRGFRLSRPGVILAVLAGLFFGSDLAFWTTGITLSGAAKPTLMANTAPIWVGLGSALLFKERQNRLFWVGLIVAMVGAALILGQDLSLAGEAGLGTFLGLLAAFFYGGYYLLTQRGRIHLDTLTFFGISSASSAVMLFLLNVGLGRPFTGYDTPTYLNFLALGTVVQVAGWLAINYAQGYLPASIVAPTLLGQPVVTAILAVILLGEQFTSWHIAGAVVVLGGVYLVHWSRYSKGGRQRKSLLE
jgi:drug/metabolite transporter (DMT)-like permease